MNLRRRARELQRSWERLVADSSLAPELPPEATAGLRPTIVESWRRSLATGLDPTDLLAPIEADESEMLGRWFEHPLGSLSHGLMEQLQKLAEDSRGIFVVTDASGLVLHRVGDEWLKERAAEMNLVEGARYSEAADGTNGIGTALAGNHAFQVFAFEHFNERHHDWVCSGVPVHDPVSGQTVGLIDLSSLWKFAHPRSLELVTTAARTIDQCLADARRDRVARLRRRYSDFMTKGTDLLIDSDGYLLDGAVPAEPSRFDIPEGGGEVVLSDGSVAVASPLGRGEAYLLRQRTPRPAKSAHPVTGLERTEQRALELAAEQAALRRVATLVARESSPDQLFAVVAEQVARILSVPHVALVRYEQDGSVVVGGFSDGDDEPFPIQSRWPLDSPGVTATVRRTGRPARVEDYTHVTGEVAAVVRDAGMHSAVACPIVVERRLWGSMVVLSPRHESFPKDTEARLTDFTELVATAIANAESRVAIGRLADEHAALRRVATLVAQETSQSQVFFAAIAEEAMQLLRTDAVRIVRYDGESGVVLAGSGQPEVTPAGFRFPLDGDTVAARIFQQGKPARQDEYKELSGPVAESVRASGIRSVAGAPVLVDGRLWGAITTGMTREEPLPQDTESRLGEFTALMATAISNAEARAEVERLADEQAALRRVATLVASGITPEEVFQAVAAEVCVLFGSDTGAIVRFEDDRTVAVLGAVSGPHEKGKRVTLDPGSAVDVVRETSRSARFDTDDPRASDMPSLVQALGIRSAVASPIVVQGKLWGALTTASVDGPLPLGAERRLTEFTELVATAVANTQAREEVTMLADEQAALRQVAVLVAQQPSPGDVFTAVTQAVGQLLDADLAVLHVFPGDGTATTIASWGRDSPMLPTGTRFPLDGDNLAARIFESGAPARLHSSDEAWERAAPDLARSLRVRSAVGAPIRVGGKLWGALIAATHRAEPWAENAETRIAAFTELVATAIANAESREALAELADEQAALRRVATLVARGAQPNEVFRAVSDEVGRVFGTEFAAIGRFEPGPGMSRFFSSGALDLVGADGTQERWEVADFLASAEVLRTGRSARSDRARWDSEEGETAERLRSLGIVSTVASPIVVEDELWGAMLVASTEELLPVDTEDRLEKFTEIVATAIANAESREARAVLTEEQAALRRVATLVAEAVPASELFGAVALEVSTLFGAAFAGLARFEGESVVVVGESVAETFPPAARLDDGGPSASAEVLRTGRSARVDAVDWSEVNGPLGDASRHLGVVSTVASPIVVEGRTWGALSISSTDEALPHDTEERLEKFSDLLATAIANAEGRSELAASRRRIVAASDDARRRIERDLHDGVQQQLVTLGLQLGAMKADPPTGDALKRQLAGVTEDVRSVFDALVETARGIHPAILSQGGLAAALRALARRSAVPVEVHAQIEGPLPDEVEVAAYYVAAETLTNAAKHARASVVHMDVATDDGTLTLMVRDDGVGGADPGGGSGLVGLQDRVEALGGTIKMDSSTGSGTCVVVTLPIATEPGQQIENLLGPPQELGSPTSPA